MAWLLLPFLGPAVMGRFSFLTCSKGVVGLATSFVYYYIADTQNIFLVQSMVDNEDLCVVLQNLHLFVMQLNFRPSVCCCRVSLLKTVHFSPAIKRFSRDSKEDATAVSNQVDRTEWK